MAEIRLEPLSLVIGVTGHRDIAAADEASLRERFGRILEELHARCPHTPRLLLSGLAAGADSLAAEEAMARGIPVMACLPMPQAEYEKDFTPEQLPRFRSLLERCARTIVTSPVREGGYVATGRFIAKYSHLLVAFWDRATSRGAGGTADVIEMRTNVRLNAGPVAIITTPRVSAARPPDPFAIERRYSVQAFDDALARIDAYNLDLAQTPAAGDPSLQDVQQRTDAAANRLQRTTVNFQRLLVVIAFLAAAIQILGHIPPLAKAIGLAAAFLAYRAARRHDYENRYQDYRAIAEGLRVQSAWQCAGVSSRLVDTEYLRMQEGDLQWIRMALRYFYLIYCEAYEHPGASAEHPVCRDWIESQRTYYARASRRERERKRSFAILKTASVAIAILCLIASALVLGNRFPCAVFAKLCPPGFVPSRGFTVLQDLLTVPLALAAVVGAVLLQIEEKENFSGNARRYERMYDVFERASNDLAAIAHGRPGDPQEILYALGRDALIEHAEWLIARRDRPMKVVVA